MERIDCVCCAWAICSPNALQHRFANHWSRKLNCSEYQVALKNRINRVLTQYRDVVYAWDVFQEVWGPIVGSMLLQ